MEVKFDINVNDYLSSKEIKEVIEDEIRKIIYRKYRNEGDLDRLIINLSYRYVFEIIDKHFDGNLSNILKEKIVEIINNLSSYVVFKDGDIYGNKESVGKKILNEEVSNSRELIKSNIERIINDYPYDEIKETIGDSIYDCIMNRLFENKESKE